MNQGSAIEPTEAALLIRSMTFGYGRDSPARSLFTDFDLRISPYEWFAVIGPSGCGKSTLARLITGIETPKAGSIELLGADPMIARASRGLGVSFQGHSLIPWLSVRQNIQLPALDLGPPAKKRVEMLARAFRISDRLEALPDELSGGMLARVSLARSMIHNPAFVLLDEPFASLDEITAIEISRYLLAWREQNPCSLFLISHDLEAVARLTDRCLCFPAGPGDAFTMIDFEPFGPPMSRSPETVARIRLRLLEKYV